MDDRTRTELEAAAFRRLLAHLREHTEVQNIDLMDLAGRINLKRSRVALSEELEGLCEDAEILAEEKGLNMDYEQAKEIIYGMPYSEWKKKYQK